MNEGGLSAQAVVVVALVVHQIAKTRKNGLRGLGRNYAPVFAIPLPRPATAFSQILALPLALAAVIWTEGAWGRWICVAFVGLWMLSIQQRLANHAWLGGLSTVAFALAPLHLDPAIARDLLTGIYLSAALFKLNGEYLFSERSAAKVVTSFYFGLLGLRPSQSQLNVLPLGVVLIEFATGVLLWVPHGVRVSLLLAIAMHAAFGVSGNFPFSIMALALWSVTLSPRNGYVVFPDAHSAVWWVAVLSAALALALSRSPTGFRSVLVMTWDAVQGAVYGILCAVALGSHGGRPSGTTTLVDCLIGAVFLVNFGLVFAGAKLEWSFAMFSSLRPFGQSWLQRGGRSDWPRYYMLAPPERLPKPLLQYVPASFLYKSTKGSHAVHEAVVYRLEHLGKQFGITFSPRHVVPDDDSGILVPSPGQAPPRRTALFFPALIPTDFTRYYLG